jgi:hypothetical protein
VILKDDRQNMSDVPLKCIFCGAVIVSDPDQEVQSEAYCAKCIARFEMICPVCGSVATFHQSGADKSSSYFGFHCPKCKGTWFDRDVLEFNPDGSMVFIRYRDNSI